MVLTLDTQTLLSELDLTTPTEAQKYALGKVITVIDSAKKAVKKFMYVKSHGALTQYQPYMISFSSTAASEVITAAPATLAAPGALIGVPQVAFTSGYYGFIQIQGDCTVLMTAETYAVGDHLQILNTGTALVVDGTSGSTSRTTASIGIAKTAGTTAVARAQYLFGDRGVIAAS